VSDTVSVNSEKQEGSAMRELRTIRKHSNRRLYDPIQMRYVTLDEVHNWVVDGTEFNVVDNDNDDKDITRSVLFQIMAARENKADFSMSLGFLLQVIRSHAEISRVMGATFLEQSLKLFHDLQRERSTSDDRAGANLKRRAHRLAELNYERWRSVLKQIYQTVADAGSRQTAPTGLGRNSIVPIPVRQLEHPSKRSPRPPGVTARRS
jgi:polyhydroxyalkanoate synthesis repressor PhaR